MTNYKIIDDSKEFRPGKEILMIALLDQNNEIHISLDESIDNIIQDKTNLYELIAEKFDKGEGVDFMEYKCLLINLDDLKREEIIQ